jgi:hypothetical protein
MSIDLAAISQRSKGSQESHFESHKVMQLVGRLGTLANGNAKT